MNLVERLRYINERYIVVINRDSKLTVVIHSIKNQYLLSDKQYKFIIDNLNKELTFMSINFFGELSSLSIIDDNDECIVLFVKPCSDYDSEYKYNDVDFEIIVR